LYQNYPLAGEIMLFPEVEKVTYKISPVDSVTCEIQLLSLPALDIASIQQLVKEKYPKFSELLDKKWKISIDGKCLSLSTSDYQDWEDFRDKFQKLLKVLIEKYSLKNFTMISLRHNNIFQLSKLGLKGVAWKNLINPAVLGVLASEDMVDNIENLENIVLIGLAGKNTTLKIDVKTIGNSENGELCMMLNTDLSEIRERSLDEITTALNHLNAGLTRIFRWTIKNRLHTSMEPQKLQ